MRAAVRPDVGAQVRAAVPVTDRCLLAWLAAVQTGCWFGFVLVFRTVWERVA